MTGRKTVAGVALASLLLLWSGPAADAYIEASYTLGRIVAECSNILVMQVDKVDKQNNRILYKKIRDIKGVHPGDVIRHNIAQAGFHPREWQTVMSLAEPGKLAVFFYNGGASETAQDTYWYQCYGAGPDWGMSHGEPFLLRSYAGRVEKLVMAVEEIMANREVIVPAMQDGDKNLLHVRQAKVQRLRASLKLLEYNASRDFIGWGGEDFKRISTMPGFSHLAALTRVDPDARGLSVADFDGDGASDILIYGERKVSLVKVDGTALSEVGLPGAIGARSASWADYNGDGRPDLLLGTPDGPKLYTNGPKGFRDDSALIPKEPYYNVTAASWIDYDGDGKPDILLANGFNGLHLYRNPGQVSPVAPKVPKFGGWSFICGFDGGFDKVNPPEQGVDLKAKYKGKGGADIGWTEGKFADGQVHSFLGILPEPLKYEVTAYLYREIDCETPAEVNCSFGSDDTLTVWCNGEKLLAQNVGRGAAPDQDFAKLKLKQGKNQLLIKICNGGGEFGFYFLPKEPEMGAQGTPFVDVTDKVGLGPDGLAGREKGDRLLVGDLNGDGRVDILYTAGIGIVLRNTANGFTEDRGSFKGAKFGGVTPVFADITGRGKLDLLVPQEGGLKLFRNDGDFKFTDITADCGDLAKFKGAATAVACADLFKKGKPDILVACLGGTNHYYRNLGNGKFEDASNAIGLDRRVLNSRAVVTGDVNKDGVVDVVFNNEGQDPFILLGDNAK
jgi:hypothetical protein